jgi:hypothetical protein
MHSEQRSYEETKQLLSSSPTEQQEKEQHVDRVNQQAGQMMPGRGETEHLAIKSVGKPGDRVPISLLNSANRPNDCLPTQTFAYVRICSDVSLVIVIDERVSRDLGIKGKCDENKCAAQNPSPLPKRLVNDGATLAIKSLCGDKPLSFVTLCHELVFAFTFLGSSVSDRWVVRIFAFRSPADGADAQGMHRKRRGDYKTEFRCAACSLQSRNIN